MKVGPPEPAGTLADEGVSGLAEEAEDAIRAVERQERANVIQSPVLEDPRQDGVGLCGGIEPVEIDVPEEPAQAFGKAPHFLDDSASSG